MMKYKVITSRHIWKFVYTSHQLIVWCLHVIYNNKGRRQLDWMTQALAKCGPAREKRWTDNDLMAYSLWTVLIVLMYNIGRALCPLYYIYYIDYGTSDLKAHEQRILEQPYIYILQYVNILLTYFRTVYFKSSRKSHHAM